MIPEISVLMPVYNGERYVGQAVESVLRQTHRNWELVVVNDGSTDKSVEVIQSYRDPRIRLIHHSAKKTESKEKGLELGATLNFGLEHVRGKFVARMDADDVSLPNRFAEQIHFLKANPEVKICGTWICTKRDNETCTSFFPNFMLFFETFEEIRCQLLFDAGMCHPTVMFNWEAFQGIGLRYDPCKVCEDYDLWARASRHFQMRNLKKVLLIYRLHASQCTRTRRGVEKEVCQRIQKNILGELGLNPTGEELEFHDGLRDGSKIRNIGEFWKSVSWLEALKKANTFSRKFGRAVFNKIVFYRFLLFSRLFIKKNAQDLFLRLVRNS